MSVMVFTRQSTPDEIVKEMDRRGDVIVAIEAKVERLERALLRSQEALVTCHSREADPEMKGLLASIMDSNSAALA